MNHRVLNEEQLNEAKYLRAQQGLSKRKLAKIFEVSDFTIWWHVYSKKSRPKQVNYYKLHNLPRPQKSICLPCAQCEICITKEFEDQRIPLNYQIGNTCITCYMENIGLSYKDLL